MTDQPEEKYMHNACIEYAVSVKNVQVRNVPERVHRVLRRRAAEAGQSLQEYLLKLLEESAARPSMTEFLDWASQQTGGKIEDSGRLIREIREEREEELWERTRPDRR